MAITILKILCSHPCSDIDFTNTDRMSRLRQKTRSQDLSTMSTAPAPNSKKSSIPASSTISTDPAPNSETSSIAASETLISADSADKTNSASQQPMEESGNKSLHNVFEKGGVIKLKALQMENILLSFNLDKFLPLLSISIRQEE